MMAHASLRWIKPVAPAAPQSGTMPRTIMGFVMAFTVPHQAGLALLSIAVFGLSAVPLEIQRRIVNDLTARTGLAPLIWLAAGYAGVALAEQTLKLLLNVYRGWLAESTVRDLRNRIRTVSPGTRAASAEGIGVEIAMIIEEAEPIGGFAAISVSEPLLQGGVLVSVVGYMLFLQPWIALMGLAFFLPQTIVIPLLQVAINRRARERIVEKRNMSGALADESNDTVPPAVDTAIGQIFTLNMGIYRLKFTMNLFMNLMYHFSVAAALCVGSWMVLEGRLDIGTVVAIVGGLGKLNDPWGDLVNWGREFSVVAVKYRLFADAVDWLSEPVAA